MITLSKLFKNRQNGLRQQKKMFLVFLGIQN